MLLNLKQLSAGHSHGEKTLDFECVLDLSEVRLWGGNPFSAPVKISGTASNNSGIFTVRYIAGFETQGVCARCLAPVKRRFDREFLHTVLIDGEDDEQTDDFITAPRGELRLDELVVSDILLEFGGVTLCGDDCKGLCPKCGKNLNEGVCGCTQPEPDSRFQVLRDILDEDK